MRRGWPSDCGFGSSGRSRCGLPAVGALGFGALEDAWLANLLGRAPLRGSDRPA